MNLNLRNFTDPKQKLVLLVAVIFIYLFSLKIGAVQLRYLIIVPSLIFTFCLITNKLIIKDYNAFKSSCLLGVILLVHLLIVTYFESSSIFQVLRMETGAIEVKFVKSYYLIFVLFFASTIFYFAHRYLDLILKNLYNLVLIFFVIFFTAILINTFYAQSDDPFFCGGLNLNQLNFLNYFFEDKTSELLKDKGIIIKISFREFFYKENSHLGFIAVPTILYSALIFFRPNTSLIFKIASIAFLIICLVKSSTTLLVGLFMSILILFAAEYKRIKFREFLIFISLLFLIITIFFNDKQCLSRLIPQMNHVDIVPELNSINFFKKNKIQDSIEKNFLINQKKLFDQAEKSIQSGEKIPEKIQDEIAMLNDEIQQHFQKNKTNMNNQKKIEKVQIVNKIQCLSAINEKQILVSMDKNTENTKVGRTNCNFFDYLDSQEDKENKISNPSLKLANTEDRIIDRDVYLKKQQKLFQALDKEKVNEIQVNEQSELFKKAQKFIISGEKVPKNLIEEIEVINNAIQYETNEIIEDIEPNFANNLRDTLDISDERGSLSGAVFFHNTRLSIISVFVKPFGWGLNRYDVAYRYLDKKYRDKEATKTITWLYALNTKDGSNNFNKLLVEFGVFGILIFIFLIFYTFSKKIPLEEKFFLLPFLITQCIRGAGYFNGGFALILFIVFLSYLKRINSIKN